MVATGAVGFETSVEAISSDLVVISSDMALLQAWSCTVNGMARAGARVLPALPPQAQIKNQAPVRTELPDPSG
jgi:hypothetical protein